MTTYIIPGGDLLESAKSHKLICGFAHGANCWSTMGAGIAGVIAREFPEIYQVDKLDERGPEQRLGNMSYGYSNRVFGFNLYTQFYPGPNARMPSIISSVQRLFEQVHDIVEANRDVILYVGFPAIGCGIGGLNLVDVVSAVNAVAESVYEDTKRRVVPVFYILENASFKQELISLAERDGITIVEDEEAIIEIEGE